MRQRDRSRKSAGRLAEISLLTGISLIMFIIEMQIPNPVPIPGIKLGLANIITVCAVYFYTPAEAAAILFVRVLLGSVFGGNISAVPYSLCGGLLCLAGMIPVRRILGTEHIRTASVIGAVLHNIGQIAAAAVIMKTFTVFAYLPFLIFSGCIAGFFTGTAAKALTEKLRGINVKE